MIDWFYTSTPPAVPYLWPGYTYTVLDHACRLGIKDWIRSSRLRLRLRVGSAGSEVVSERQIEEGSAGSRAARSQHPLRIFLISEFPWRASPRVSQIHLLSEAKPCWLSLVHVHRGKIIVC
jgi:hypothetical protein